MSAPIAACPGCDLVDPHLHDRGLAQVSYLSGRLAGLAGSSRYELTPACRDELAALAAIAECAYVLLEESRG